MDLATLLLRAADVLAQREETDSASDDYTVPDARSSSVRSRKMKLKISRRPVPEPEEGYRSGSGDEDNGVSAVPQHRGGANARHGARKVGSGSRRGAMQHNEVEKRRRAYLAACYVELKATLPSIASSKASNVSILRAAVSKIQHLEQQERELDAERAALYAERRMLLSRRAAGPGMAALLEASESASDTSMMSDDSATEMEVPDASRRSLSPDMAMSYDQQPLLAGKLGHYGVQTDMGGKTGRRRSRNRPVRFL